MGVQSYHMKVSAKALRYMPRVRWAHFFDESVLALDALLHAVHALELPEDVGHCVDLYGAAAQISQALLVALHVVAAVVFHILQHMPGSYESPDSKNNLPRSKATPSLATRFRGLRQGSLDIIKIPYSGLNSHEDSELLHMPWRRS